MTLVTPRPINLALWSATTVLVCGAALALSASFPRPLATAQSNDEPPTVPRVAVAPQGNDDFKQYEPIWSRSLRNLTTVAQAPQPTAQPAAATSIADPNAMPLTLVGTVGHSLALLKT